MQVITFNTGCVKTLTSSITNFVQKSTTEFRNLLKSVSNSPKQFYFTYINQHTSKDIDTFANNSNRYSKEYITSNGFLIGEGEFGKVYKIGKYVVKIALEPDSFSSPTSNCTRTARILNEFNGNDYSREATLQNEENVLVSKFIQGSSVIGERAFEFVKSKGGIMYDIDSEGNVKEGADKKLYLIDSDMVVYPERQRRASVASDAFYQNNGWILDLYRMELAMRGLAD